MKYQDQAKDNDKLVLLSGDVHHLSWWRISWWCRSEVREMLSNRIFEGYRFALELGVKDYEY
jgi:hypothetical protein